MCNIAGYTGFRQAAPLLIDMLKREEGFWGGHYTGIATIDQGNLYCAKVVGDVETLLRQTDAMNFPGTVGFIHSRPASGGDREWAYPFVSEDHQLAFVENGDMGQFEGSPNFATLAMELMARGHRLNSATKTPVTGYPQLEDGSSFHYSEVQCLLLEEILQEGFSPLEAMETLLCRYPCDDVCVALHSRHPDRLFIGRVTQPMMLARGVGEAFIATTSLAFPPSCAPFGIDLLPANACMELAPKTLLMRNGIRPDLPVAPVTPSLLQKAIHTAKDLLETASAPVPFSTFAKACGTCFPKGSLPQMPLLGYLTLEALLGDGKVRLLHERKDGMEPGLTAPVTLIQPI